MIMHMNDWQCILTWQTHQTVYENHEPYYSTFHWNIFIMCFDDIMIYNKTIKLELREKLKNKRKIRRRITKLDKIYDESN